MDASGEEVSWWTAGPESLLCRRGIQVVLAAMAGGGATISTDRMTPAMTNTDAALPRVSPRLMSSAPRSPLSETA